MQVSNDEIVAFLEDQLPQVVASARLDVELNKLRVENEELRSLLDASIEEELTTAPNEAAVS